MKKLLCAILLCTCMCMPSDAGACSSDACGSPPFTYTAGASSANYGRYHRKICCMKDFLLVFCLQHRRLDRRKRRHWIKRW